MRRAPRSLHANAVLALAGDAASKAAAFAVVAICARFLRLTEFAHLGVALAGLTVLSSLTDAGVATLIVRDCAARPSSARAVLRASIVGRAPLVALAGAVGVSGGLFIGDLWLGVATAVAGVAAACSLSMTAVFRAAQDLAPEAIQKCSVALVTLGGAAFVAAVWGRAAAVVGVLAAALSLSLAPLWLSARRRLPAASEHVAAIDTLRAALPFGLMGLATLLYYRLGILLLGAVGSASATGSYTVASTLAFGLLMVPNAITTGLLPRLSSQDSRSDQLKTARSALSWTVIVCVSTSVVAASAAPYVLRYGFAPRYESALWPLLVLFAGTVVIGINGVLGTVLIASRHAAIVAIQIGVSLIVNGAAAIALVPRFGAMGAALATLLAELVALAMLAGATRRFAPDLLRLPTVTSRRRVTVGAEAPREARL